MSGFMFKFLVYFIFTSPVFAGIEYWTNSAADLTSFIKLEPSSNATYLQHNVKYIKEGREPFGIFCSHAVSQSVFQTWRTVQFIMLDIPLKNQYDIFPGRNETEVYDNYMSKSTWYSSFLFSGSDAVIDFPAFSSYCIGIACKENYSFYLKVRVINYWKLLQTLVGVFIFFAAPNLSRNPIFHYASGIIVGIVASLLILLYVVSRLIPQRGISYTLLVFGYSFALYFLKVLWHQFHDIVTNYLDYVLGYCAAAAFVSFVICYRIGPVTSERTLNLMQWSMQVISFLLIFFSSEYREVSTAINICILGVKLIPSRWIKKFKFLWRRCFPPRVKLLTELEFIEQGHVETTKALENLRQYCSSPDCNVWKVVRKLKDPVRFAEFIEKGSHYTDQELLAYNSEDDYLNVDDYEENTSF